MRVPPIVIAAAVLSFAGVLLASSAGASREVVVYMTASGFSPASSTVAVGDRVRFTVRDKKPHQVAKTSGPNAGDVPPTVLEGKGNSVTLTPQEAGRYSYVDRLNARRAEYQLTVRR
jgi:plastocyanin